MILTECLQIFFREALCWGHLNHPNILPFLGVDMRILTPAFCLFSPWMDNGNLMNFLAKNPDFDPLKAAIDTAEGLRYLHELDPPIVHGDIRGANILVTSELRCCLADFGLAVVATEMSITSVRHGGTEAWMAPEILRGIPAGTAPSPTRDIYICLRMFTGKPPFYGIPRGAATLKVVNGERPPRPAVGASGQEINDEIWDIITSCWKHQATERPSAGQVLQDLGIPPPPNYTLLCRPGQQPHFRPLALPNQYMHRPLT
ncbi:kinase-like protein [Mycena vulgaris]|nr:kinase-like protein [Mycena vulgaris]